MKYLLPLLILAGCQAPVDKDFVVETGQREVVSQLEPNVNTHLEIRDRGSHIRFTCTAQWVGDPLDSRAPKSALSKVCVGGRCVKNDLGAVAELTVWAKDFDLIKEEAHCLVFMPSWFILEGLPPNQTISEYYNERFIMSVRYPLDTYWIEIPSDFRDYCVEVECDWEGCRCLQWD